MASGADEMVDKAFDPKQQDVVAKAIEQLSPEEAGYFLDKLERAIRKRKIQLGGYLAAMVVFLFGMVWALFYYGAQPEGTFVGWVFIIPFAGVGAILVLFGKWAERAARAPTMSTAADAAFKERMQARARAQAGKAAKAED